MDRRLLLDPRDGDAEDDASSTRRRSLLAIAGSLLAEISFPKLLLALALSVVGPAVLVGVAPIIVSAGYQLIARRFLMALAGVVPMLLLLLALTLAWLGGRTLWRAVERSFWALNAMAVQPVYLLSREAIRHLAERVFRADQGPDRRMRIRARSSAATAIILLGVSAGLVLLAWPASRWRGDLNDLIYPYRLVVPALINALIVIAAYLGAAGMVWGIADATMEQPRDLPAFDVPKADARKWRIAHLSDLHAVGGAFEFRLESGRLGPRGNGRIKSIFASLDAVHAQQPLDVVLVTGDMTDAGRNTEWAAFQGALLEHPELAKRTLLLPGNHDLNIVDRANPARLELPTSAGKRLRQMRALAAMEAVQGDRALTVDRKTGRPGPTLSEFLRPHAAAIQEFSDTGSLRLSLRLFKVWDDAFPMILPPDATGGLGVVLLNSNAESHFSFTNALGLVDTVEIREMLAATHEYPGARWIVALHHHLVEYPRRVNTFSERIGTALVNGSWFVRQLRPLDGRGVVMHGHRHIDWIGQCGRLRIVSAPSPVMGSPGSANCAYIHILTAAEDPKLMLARPERVVISEDGDGA